MLKHPTFIGIQPVHSLLLYRNSLEEITKTFKNSRWRIRAISYSYTQDYLYSHALIKKRGLDQCRWDGRRSSLLTILKRKMLDCNGVNDPFVLSEFGSFLHSRWSLILSLLSHWMYYLYMTSSLYWTTCHLMQTSIILHSTIAVFVYKFSIFWIHNDQTQWLFLLLQRKLCFSPTEIQRTSLKNCRASSELCFGC